MGSKRVGFENPHWKGGTRNWWAKWLKANVGVCEKCGSTLLLEIHHKDHDDRNNKRENIVLLCRHCHRSIEHLGKAGVNKGRSMSGMITKSGNLMGRNNSYSNPSYREKLRIKKLGANNPSWKNGISYTYKNRIKRELGL